MAAQYIFLIGDGSLLVAFTAGEDPKEVLERVRLLANRRIGRRAAPLRPVLEAKRQG